MKLQVKTSFLLFLKNLFVNIEALEITADLYFFPFGGDFPSVAPGYATEFETALKRIRRVLLMPLNGAALMHVNIGR